MTHVADWSVVFYVGENGRSPVREFLNVYRLLYFFAPGRRIVFWHGFPKNTQKTPRREIETAQRRLERFLLMEGGV